VARILLETDKFRVVEDDNGNKTVERFDGCAAMGEPRWER
jgi:hypothetical protein